jgi:hypothetical protein
VSLAVSLLLLDGVGEEEVDCGEGEEGQLGSDGKDCRGPRLTPEVDAGGGELLLSEYASRDLELGCLSVLKVSKKACKDGAERHTPRNLGGEGNSLLDGVLSGLNGALKARVGIVAAYGSKIGQRKSPASTET